MAGPRNHFVGKSRTFHQAEPTDDAELGPLTHLPGTWKSTGGTGWNMIALPFANGPFHFRLLLNRYDETLSFTVVGKDIPNRGIATDASGKASEADQRLVSLDYEQDITQLAAIDSPASGMAGGSGLAIHHEPGLWIYMNGPGTTGPNLARMATIPHGDSVLALGTGIEQPGAPSIPEIGGLPIGLADDLETSPYLAPYKEFRDQPFQGLFDPTRPTQLLRAANEGVNITKTTILSVDSTMPSGGIVNIPFIVKQANATEMRATFFIEELAEVDASGRPKLRLQYAQVVMLDFFPRNDGKPGLIRWPHVSINTLEKVSDHADS